MSCCVVPCMGLVRLYDDRIDFYLCLYSICDQDFIKAEPADAMKTPVRHLVMSTCANLMYPWPVPAMDPEIVSKCGTCCR